MALIEMNFISQCLMRTVTVNAIVPFDNIAMPGMPQKEISEYKTLYLLHGIFGNYTDWVSGTRIQRWAQEKNLVVIMPSGENHFYVDCEANGERYSEFIGKELPEKMQKLFPLSKKREDNFIAGLSMGGYGAITNGLKYYNTFGCVAGLSSALVLEKDNSHPDITSMIFGEKYKETIFGKEDLIKGSNKDYYALAQSFKSDATKAPKMYLCCGTEDSLLNANRKFASLLGEIGIPCTYEEGAGGHDWDFWDTYIKRVIDWLPLENAEKSVNSGNVT